MPDVVIDVPHTQFVLRETVHSILTGNDTPCTTPVYNIAAILDGVMIEHCIHCGQGRSAHALPEGS